MNDYTFGKLLARKLVIRNDSEGAGFWHAPRGTRLHKGVDIEVYPHENIFSPIDAVVARFAYPYQGDVTYRGIVLEGKWCELRMFYLLPVGLVPGQFVRKNELIGQAQDVSKRYSSKMKPHIHLQIGEDGPIDPSIFMQF